MDLKRDLGNDRSAGRSTPKSLSRPVSPPPKRRKLGGQEQNPSGRTEVPQLFKSPFSLTRIDGLSGQANNETVTLNEILGDPLISECWEFNYLHDIDFLMEAFDEDIRHIVKIHVVHGFWKQEDTNREHLESQASRYKNVFLHTAFLPDMFGTHHSKMMILLRHDDTAQIIIHTANMIKKDWLNMTQAVWRSPLLPLLPPGQPAEPENMETGSGGKFKLDFLSYLRAYRTRCKAVADELTKYDFSAIKGTLIASVPGRHDPGEGQWGWAAMKKALAKVPVKADDSEIVAQISSIATLGVTDTWLCSTFFEAFRSGSGKASLKVVFPTADEIRRSLDGYDSGGSIHTKTQSAQQAKQLLYLRPKLHHWANDAPQGEPLGDDAVRHEAGRQRAAPHIKTYIRYDKSYRSIDWALVTSANLSKQAWGEATKTGEFHIHSYEMGVLVWPSLFAPEAVMTPTFQTDQPRAASEGSKAVVGMRMPYNLPLQRYGRDEKPWVASMAYDELDWRGNMWPGWSNA